MDRREFMKTAALAGTAVLLNPWDVLLRRTMASPKYFRLHPFVEAHPEAVFIKRTNVAVKTDSEAKRREGFNFAKEIFSLSDTSGIPLSRKIAIKPNLTCTGKVGNTVDGMGILTDKDFMDGMIEGMKDVGFPAERMYMREGNWLGDAYCPTDYKYTGYTEVAERTGVHLLDFPTGRMIYQLNLTILKEGDEVIWKDVPEGIVFKRIGYVAPFNDPDAWLLDVAKFKAHGMGLTLTVKNLQGMCVHPLIHFCEGVDRTKKYPKDIFDAYFKADLEGHVAELHAKHLKEGVPRWDKPGRNWNSGYGMEMWAQRTCDSLSVTNVGLAVVEGIYGRDGNGFMKGPGGKANDYMTNVIIFGKNPFKVDIIGHWLGGHEPGNFGLFHIAKERGLTDTFNPHEIPVYLWEEGVPKLVSLDELERFELKTYYLQRNYNGQNEPLWHLVNEPYDYGPTSVEATEGGKPEAYVLGQNYPNPFNSSTIIEYRLPKDGYVTLEVFNSRGQRVDVLVRGWRRRGVHMAVWNADGRASGVYIYRLRVDGFERTKRMVLVR